MLELECRPALREGAMSIHPYVLGRGMHKVAQGGGTSAREKIGAMEGVYPPTGTGGGGWHSQQGFSFGHLRKPGYL